MCECNFWFYSSKKKEKKNLGFGKFDFVTWIIRFSFPVWFLISVDVFVLYGFRVYQLWLLAFYIKKRKKKEGQLLGAEGNSRYRAKLAYYN